MVNTVELPAPRRLRGSSTAAQTQGPQDDRRALCRESDHNKLRELRTQSGRKPRLRTACFL